jgi:hypothetical protein
MALGPEHDDGVLRLLALGTPMTATSLGRELKVDDGALTIRIINHLLRDGLVEIVDAAGPNPVWAITDAGRERVKPPRG